MVVNTESSLMCRDRR